MRKYVLDESIKRMSGIPLTEEISDKDILKYGEMGKEAVGLGLTNGLTWIGYTEEEVEGILKNQVMKHFFESRRDKIADFIQGEIIEYFGEKKKIQFMAFDK